MFISLLEYFSSRFSQESVNMHGLTPAESRDARAGNSITKVGSCLQRGPNEEAVRAPRSAPDKRVILQQRMGDVRLYAHVDNVGPVLHCCRAALFICKHEKCGN